MPGEEARRRAYKSELANSLGKLAGSEMALGHLEKARELYREEIAVRESFSPAKANDWEARRELAGLLRGTRDTDRADWAIWTKDSSSTTNAPRSASRLRRKSPISGRLRTISPCRTTIKGRCVFRWVATRKPHGSFTARPSRSSENGPRPTRRTSTTSTTLGSDALLRSDLRPSFRRQRRGGRGLSRMPEDLQRAGHRAHGKVAEGRSDARAGPLRRSCRGRQDRRGARGRHRPRTKPSTSRPPAALLSPRRRRAPAVATPALVQHYIDRALECLRDGQGKRLGGRRGPRDRYRPRTNPQGPGIPGLAR